MRIDDDAITSLEILDKDGTRLARSVSTEDLVKDDFKLKINGTAYHVVAPVRTLVGKRGVVLAGTLAEYPQFKKIQEYIANEATQCESIAYSTFEDKCQDFGFDKVQAAELVRILSTLGVILHVSCGLDVVQKIYLHPNKIREQVETTLNLPVIRLTHQQRVNLHQQLRAELIPLEEKRNELYHIAENRIQVLAWVVFFGLCGQFLLFARLTWWDYSWDVMEPITWFTSICETVIAGKMYFLSTRQEYTNMGIRGMLVQRQFDALAKRLDFDQNHYEQLRQQIAMLEAEIEFVIEEVAPST